MTKSTQHNPRTLHVKAKRLHDDLKHIESRWRDERNDKRRRALEIQLHVARDTFNDAAYAYFLSFETLEDEP